MGEHPWEQRSSATTIRTIKNSATTSTTSSSCCSIMSPRSVKSNAFDDEYALTAMGLGNANPFLNRPCASTSTSSNHNNDRLVKPPILASSSGGILKQMPPFPVMIGKYKIYSLLTVVSSKLRLPCFLPSCIPVLYVTHQRTRVPIVAPP